MKSVVFQIQKPDNGEFANIQDACLLKPDMALIADGATQGFQSGRYANDIVNSIGALKKVNYSEIETAVISANSIFEDAEINYSTNPAIKALEQTKSKIGGASTLTATWLRDGKVHYLNVGDSTLLLFNSDIELKWSLHKNSRELESDGLWLSSKDTTNLKNSRQGIIEEYCDGDVLVVLSDAIAKYILEFPEKIKDILKIESTQHFIEWVDELWDAKSLEFDDITIVIWYPGTEECSVCIPSTDFKLEKYIQERPAVLSDYYNEAFMKEFNQLKSDFNRLLSRVNELERRQYNLKKSILIVSAVLIGLGLYLNRDIVFTETQEVLDSFKEAFMPSEESNSGEPIDSLGASFQDSMNSLVDSLGVHGADSADLVAGDSTVND